MIDRLLLVLCALAITFAIGAAVAIIFSGCTAIPAAAGYFTSGGVTVYKTAKESGPKAEFVLFKTRLII